MAAEAALDGIYVIRTGVPKRTMSSDDAVRNYKALSSVERAFRSLKTVDLKVRPIHHHLEARVRAHIFLCMLAYYVEWHMREAWRKLMFADEDQVAKATRDPVAPARDAPLGNLLGSEGNFSLALRMSKARQDERDRRGDAEACETAAAEGNPPGNPSTVAVMVIILIHWPRDLALGGTLGPLHRNRGLDRAHKAEHPMARSDAGGHSSGELQS